MQFVDHGYEDRLIQRIEARRLIATRLKPRERAILCGYYLHGDTLREVGAQDGGVSAERTRQILLRALRILKAPARPPPAPLKPRRPFDLRATPPPGFDWAEFLRHQQRLIERRQVEARETFERERAKLDEMLEAEAYVPKPAPTPNPGYTYTYKPPPTPAPPPPPPPNVEPWFDLARPLTIEHLQQIGFYALNYFSAIRSPMPLGSSAMSGYGACVECARTADAVATALQQLARHIHARARFLTQHLPVPEGVLGASVGSNYVAMRVCSMQAGQRVSIEVTWDIPP